MPECRTRSGGSVVKQNLQSCKRKKWWVTWRYLQLGGGSPVPAGRCRSSFLSRWWWAEAPPNPAREDCRPAGPQTPQWGPAPTTTLKAKQHWRKPWNPLAFVLKLNGATLNEKQILNRIWVPFQGQGTKTRYLDLKVSDQRLLLLPFGLFVPLGLGLFLLFREQRCQALI